MNRSIGRGWRLRSILTLVIALALQGAIVALASSPAFAYEVHVSLTGAGQVNETTGANLVGNGCVTSATNPTGVVGVDCSPGDPSGDYGWGWTVRFVATPKPGYRFVHWTSDGTANPVICDGANGSSTYSGSACQFATYDNLQLRAVFVDDAAPSMSSLTGPNQTVGGAATFSFSAASDPTLRRFECRVAGIHDWTTCSSGHSENPSSSGTYTFEVRAVDWSNNRSAVSNWLWTVDKTPPLVNITGPADNSYDLDGDFSVSGGVEPGSTVTLYEGATTLGSVASPGGSWSIPVNATNGAHDYTARATDGVGNTSAFTAARTVVVDTVKPTVASVTPLAGATGVPGGSNVVASFSEPVRAGTVKTTTVTLVKRGTTTPVAATVTYDPVTRRAVLNPSAQLAGRTMYDAKVTRGIRDVAGHSMASPHLWSFKTRR